MESLSVDGCYEITEEMKSQLADFYGNYCSEGETYEAISALYYGAGYLIDTQTEDATPAVVASTASPYKFTRSVMYAVNREKYETMSDFELVDELSKISGCPVPRAIEEIRTAPVLHDSVVDAKDMPAAVKKILGI